jgi:3-oxoadipate enol-lactonase
MPYFKTADGASLYYETLGFDSLKPILIFLNGTMQTTIYWQAVTSHFKPFFRILLYDARGQGESDLGGRELSLKCHVDDLKALMLDLSITHASLVGLSHGAYVALSLANDSPHRIDRLVLCSVSAKSTGRAKLIVRSWLETIERCGLEAMVGVALPHVFGERFLRENEKIMDHLARSVARRNRKDSLTSHFKAMQQYTPLARILKPLSLPVLVLSGTEDLLVTPRGARMIADACGGRHMELPGVGHSFPAEDPQGFQKTVLAFLKGEWHESPEGF